jgi:hypothetical protein
MQMTPTSTPNGAGVPGTTRVSVTWHIADRSSAAVSVQSSPEQWMLMRTQGALLPVTLKKVSPGN